MKGFQAIINWLSWEYYDNDKKNRKKIKTKIQEKDHEKNLSTQEKTKKQSTRIPQENGDDGRKKGIKASQSKRQKEIDPLIFVFEK